jgi:hypothetical protein
MKPVIALFVAGLVLATGCATIPGNTPVIVIQGSSGHDLRVQAWDRWTQGPAKDVKISVAQTGDFDFTNSDGWTRRLAVPPEANGVRIYFTWATYQWSTQPIMRTHDRWVQLRHGTTECRVDVDTGPIR